MSLLKNLAFLTYLLGKPRNTYIHTMHEFQNFSNASRHKEVVVSLLNLPCYIHFSCLQNFKHLFWKIMILQLWRYSSGEAICKGYLMASQLCIIRYILQIQWKQGFWWKILCMLNTECVVLYLHYLSIGHFSLGGVAHNSPDFLSIWYFISSTDMMKFP